jgi:hypothetical protein
MCGSLKQENRRSGSTDGKILEQECLRSFWARDKTSLNLNYEAIELSCWTNLAYEARS